MEKIPPNNLEAEKSLLGAALSSESAMSDVSEYVEPDDFYDAAHREIYSAMIDMFRMQRPVDIVTVSEELKKRKKLESVGGRTYISELPMYAPVTTNAGEYAKIVAEKSSLRRLIKAADEIKEASYNSAEDTETILDNAEQAIFGIAQTRQKRDFKPLADIVWEDLEHIGDLQRNAGKLTGVTTGFRRLDDNLGGFQKSNLIILAAPPGMGKTAFALNVAANAAIKGGAKVLIFSLEMANMELGERMLSMEAKVELEKLKKGKIQQSDWERLGVASDRLAKATINIDDNGGVSVFEIRNKCRRMKADKGLDLVVVDHLGLMTWPNESNRVMEISKLTRYLKLMAKELEVPVLVLSQLSREAAKGKRMPQLTDLRDSGSIEQDADVVIFLHRAGYYDKDAENANVCTVRIAKHRNGSTGDYDLNWDGRFTRFTEIAPNMDPGYLPAE